MVSSPTTNRTVFSSPDNISTHLRRSYSERNNYTTQFFGRKLDVAVTSDPHTVQSWIDKSLHLQCHRLHSRDGKTIVGLGTQWRPSQNDHRPATIQMCIGHRVLIYQILHSSSDSTALSDLLSDNRVTFVGYNIGNDCRLHSSHYGLEVTSPTEELRSVSGMGTASMESMAERILGFPGVKKPEHISKSDWDAPELSLDQVQYAALDAYLSFQLGVELVGKPALRVKGSHNEVVGADADRRYGSESDGESGSESGSVSSPTFTMRGETGVIGGVNVDQHYGSESDSEFSPSFTVKEEHDSVVGLNADHHDGSESDSKSSPTSTMIGGSGVVVGVNTDQHYGTNSDSGLSPDFVVRGDYSAVQGVNADEQHYGSESDGGSSPGFSVRGEYGVVVGVNTGHQFRSESGRAGVNARIGITAENYEYYYDNHWESDVYGESGLDEFEADEFGSYFDDDYGSTEYAW